MQSHNYFFCNAAGIPPDLEVPADAKLHCLEYRPTQEDCNVKLSLPDFIRNVFHLPDRILDLLEIAAYVFSADRSVSRGRKDALEFSSWARSFHFIIKVRDFDFWKQDSVIRKLSQCLSFMTGDREYSFTFLPGHSTPPTSLFDSKKFKIRYQGGISIILFSGGLDSLAGSLERLERSKDQICLVSHRSQPGLVRTQDQLFKSLRRIYKDRVKHYRFHCSLKTARAKDETQRTRAFLYCSIAYSLCHAFSQRSFFVYENGITALNFPKRQDMINARASRTTHPKTITLLQNFFTELEGAKIQIKTPFLWHTKTDVYKTFAELQRLNLATSSVSCSKTFQNLGAATHCGGCSQCIDRRFAAYGSELDDVDESGLYAFDFVRQQVSDGEVKTSLLDYVRQARDFAEWNIDRFNTNMMAEFIDIVDYLPGADEFNKIETLWNLCRRHGEQVLRAIRRMRTIYDNPFQLLPPGCFLKMIAEREYLKEPVLRLVEALSSRLERAIPIAFRKNRPKDENDLNDKISAILNSDRTELEREHPAIPFALTKAIPDHSFDNYYLLIESKYVRGSSTVSKITDGMAADLIKYPEESHILFVVFDPETLVFDKDKFRKEFEKKSDRCTVCIIR